MSLPQGPLAALAFRVVSSALLGRTKAAESLGKRRPQCLQILRTVPTSSKQAPGLLMDRHTKLGLTLLEMQLPRAAGRNERGSPVIIAEHLCKLIYRCAGMQKINTETADRVGAEIAHVDKHRAAIPATIPPALALPLPLLRHARHDVLRRAETDGFGGVLVSDFYTAYDSVPCAQQKCLIHLMREINDDLHTNPFNDELKEIAGQFGALLREIVKTIDAYGLKARHLGKHRKSAAGFIERVVAMKCTTEAGSALKKRIEKNRDKLFTFLDYNGVPWNNNNAEHALRAFTRLRNIMTTSTPKGHREYATLLSVQQTLRYRGISFLEFMRSGRMEIEG
jgi:hypothetical protein